MRICFKKTAAYDLRIGDRSSDVCSSDLIPRTRSASSRFPSCSNAESIRLPERSRARPANQKASHDKDRRSDHRVPCLPRPVPSHDASRYYGRRGSCCPCLARSTDRKSTRLNSVTNAHLVCRLLLEKKKKLINTQM